MSCFFSNSLVASKSQMASLGKHITSPRAFRRRPCLRQTPASRSYLLELVVQQKPITAFQAERANGPQQYTSCRHVSFVAGFDKLGGFQKDKHAEMLQSIPLSRMGTKWDIGMACVFLASELWSTPFKSLTHMALAAIYCLASHICVTTCCC